MKVFSKLFLTLSFLVFGACSSENPTDSRKQELTDISGSSGDFGSMLVGDKVDDRIFVFTKGAESSINATVNLSGEDFSIISSSGCNKVIAKTTDKCSVKVRFLKNKIIGSYAANLTVGSGPGEVSVSLTAEVRSPEPESIPNPLSIKEGGIDVDSLNFGEILLKGSLTKILEVYNSGSSSVTIATSLSGENYSLVANTCSSLLPKKSCQIKINLKSLSQNPEEDTSLTGSLSINSLVVSLSGLHKKVIEETSGPGSNSTQLSVYGILIDDGLSFSTLSSGSESKIITVQNTGSKSVLLPITLSGDSSFSLSSSSCSGTLNSGKSCLIRISFSSVGQSNGSKSAEVSIGSSSIDLTGIIQKQATVPVVESLAGVKFFVRSQDTNQKTTAIHEITEGNSSFYVGDDPESGKITLSANTCSLSSPITIKKIVHNLVLMENQETTIGTKTCAELSSFSYTLANEDILNVSTKIKIEYLENGQAKTMETEYLNPSYKFIKEGFINIVGTPSSWFSSSYGTLQRMAEIKILKPHTLLNIDASSSVNDFSIQPPPYNLSDNGDHLTLSVNFTGAQDNVIFSVTPYIVINGFSLNGGAFSVAMGKPYPITGSIMGETFFDNGRHGWEYYVDSPYVPRALDCVPSDPNNSVFLECGANAGGHLFMKWRVYGNLSFVPYIEMNSVISPEGDFGDYRSITLKGISFQYP